MKRVALAFLVFGLVASGVYFLTGPEVDASEKVSLEQGGETELPLQVRNAGTVRASFKNTEGGTTPQVRLSEGSSPSRTATASVPPADTIQPSVTVEVPEDIEPGEYTLEVTVWRLPNERGEKASKRVTVVVEEPDEQE
jgi:uncharacterized membrane protein